MKYFIQFLTAFASVSRSFLFALALLVVFTACFDDEDSSSELTQDTDLSEIYTSPVDINYYLFNIAQKSDLCKYEELGLSSDGNFTISKIILSDNPEVDEKEPEILIIGAVHGDEQAASFVPLKLATYLLENSSDPEISALLSSCEIHIIAVMNPWGLFHKRRYTVNSVDLNRNFSWAWTDEYAHGDAPFDQKESQIIRDDALNRHYSLSIAFHSGENCISTSWDYIGTLTSEGSPSSYSYDDFVSVYMPNAATVFSYSEKYASDVVQAGDTGFYSIEGFDWYPCYGTVADWLYGVRGCLSYTIELTERKVYYPNYDITQVWDLHRDALLDLLEIASVGIKGTVLSSEGEVINGKVTLQKQSRNPKDPVPYSLFGIIDSGTGFYHVICDPGTYLLTVTAEDHQTSSQTITVGSSQTLDDIQLSPIL